MAYLESTITLRSGEYRPCFVDGKKALFHGWVDENNLVPISPIGGEQKVGGPLLLCKSEKETYGLVELESGEIITVFPKFIKFIPMNFNEYCFEDKGEKNNVN